jgi:molybdopterin synthase catalytic subunit
MSGTAATTGARLIDLRETPLSIDEAVAAVADPAAGGLVVFVGSVRDHDDDRAVTRLAYTAHPSALDSLRGVVDEVAARFGGARLAAVHRYGELAIGDVAVVVAASAPHRDEAFAAARLLIDELKERVPIWKEQHFADGDVEWVGSP